MNTKPLTELADIYISDKGMMRASHHGYTYVYEMLFQHLKDKSISLLELGLARTSEDFRGRSELRSCELSPSVAMWLDYFSKAHVTGFDLSDFSNHHDSRFTFVQGDLGKEEDYRLILAARDQFDIIVDDGSHASLHQMLAFAHLFSSVKDGGFYVIEDTWRQPPMIEKQNPTSHTISQLFREFLTLGCFPETAPVSCAMFNELISQIGNILFIPYHNAQGAADQLIVVHKKIDSRFHLYRSKIRFFRKQPSADDLDSLRRHTQVSPLNPYPLYNLANFAFTGSDYTQALEYADKALLLCTDDSEIVLLKAQILACMGKYDEAYEFAVRHMIEPVGSDVIAISLAQEFIRLQEYTRAGNLLEQHLGIAPDSSKGHFLSGKCHEALDDWTSASACYARAFEILPTKLVYLEAYTRMSRKLEDSSVIDMLGNNRSNFADEPDFTILLANTCLHFGMQEQAIAEARSLLGTSKDAWARKFMSRLNPVQKLLRKLVARTRN